MVVRLAPPTLHAWDDTVPSLRTLLLNRHRRSEDIYLEELVEVEGS